MITVVPYVYRDASNYKAFGQVTLSGEITDEQREKVRLTLASINEEHDGFIPEQIGWEHLGSEQFDMDAYDDDHCWHELDVADIYTQQDAGGVAQAHLLDSVDSWVKKMEDAASVGWNDTLYAR